jgi:release factor glutamine methyltransferase
MGNFWSTLKIELVYRTSWRTRDEAENAIFSYIDTWYTTRRIQGAGLPQPRRIRDRLHTRQTKPIEPEIVIPAAAGAAVLVEMRPGDRVLDMGTGSGVNAILAASKSTDVVAVDINPQAVEAARRNVIRNGVADRFDVRHSDVFGSSSPRRASQPRWWGTGSWSRTRCGWTTTLIG